MGLLPLDIAPGLFSNRTPYSSRGRWTDGNLVRFRDGVPEQVGGWRRVPLSGLQQVAGRARHFISWRPNGEAAGFGRFGAIGSHEGIFLFDGGSLRSITPAGFDAGRVDSVLGTGFGIGLYGTGTYGTPRAGGTEVLEAATWSLDMWGEQLVGCCTESGIIYSFLAGTDTTMVAVSGAPTAYSLVVTDERHLFALGAGGVANRISWCDREDLNEWTPSSTNRAGGYNLQTAGKLRCGHRFRGQTLVWSDQDLFGFFPTANSFVYGYDRLGQKCGVAGPRAAIVVNDVAYWMGVSDFFRYDGVVAPIQCDLYDYVFKDINMVQRAKFQVAHNSLFDEILFFYCSKDSNEIDRGVSFNPRTGVWSKWNIDRLAWCDRSVFDRPLAINTDGHILEHESGVTADGAPMESFIESYPVELGRGDRVQNMSAIVPDAENQGGVIAMTIKGQYLPRGEVTTFGPYVIDQSTDRIPIFAAARQAAFRIEAGVPGDRWELGLVRVQTVEGGLR